MKKSFFSIAFSLIIIFTTTGIASAGIYDLDFYVICGTGTLEEVEAAIQKVEDINRKNNRGQTALMCAAWINSDPEVTSFLIAHGANVNTQYGRQGENNGKTALMYAALRNPNSKVIIPILLNAGADVNIKDEDGRKAIDYAKENKRRVGAEALKLLEEASK